MRFSSLFGQAIRKNARKRHIIYVKNNGVILWRYKVRLFHGHILESNNNYKYSKSNFIDRRLYADNAYIHHNIASTRNGVSMRVLLKNIITVCK